MRCSGDKMAGHWTDCLPEYCLGDSGWSHTSPSQQQQKMVANADNRKNVSNEVVKRWLPLGCSKNEVGDHAVMMRTNNNNATNYKIISRASDYCVTHRTKWPLKAIRMISDVFALSLSSAARSYSVWLLNSINAAHDYEWKCARFSFGNNNLNWPSSDRFSWMRALERYFYFSNGFRLNGFVQSAFYWSFIRFDLKFSVSICFGNVGDRGSGRGQANARRATEANRTQTQNYTTEPCWVDGRRAR